MKISPLATHERVTDNLRRLLTTFVESDAVIRPHCFIAGPTGCGKTATITMLCEELGIPYVEVNAAALTKEGLSGNSLSKALAPVKEISQDTVGVVIVDEFDKLLISGNTNGELAHESTNGVQNEFLTVLEKNFASVFGDYGKYVNIPVNHLLFVFCGAFNGEQQVNHQWLKTIGVKTEFLGRVPLIYNIPSIELEDILKLVDNYQLLIDYFTLEGTSEQEQEIIKDMIKTKLTNDFKKNTLGIRYLGSLVHQIFINGKIDDDEDNSLKKVVKSQKFSRPKGTDSGEVCDGRKATSSESVGTSTTVRKTLSKKLSGQSSNPKS